MTEYDVILPIKPKYMRRILSGEKKYEVRKRLWTVDVKRIFFYESTPVRKVTAYMEYEDHEKLPPSLLWARYGGGLGLSEEEFMEQFGDAKKLYCIPLDNIKPIPAKDLEEFGVDRPPQTFRYISHEDIQGDIP